MPTFINGIKPINYIVLTNPHIGPGLPDAKPLKTLMAMVDLMKVDTFCFISSLSSVLAFTVY